MNSQSAIYENYRGMIVSRASSYAKQYGIDTDDLISQGHIIYLKALDTFEHDRGCSFPTYLHHCLRALTDYCRKESGIRTKTDADSDTILVQMAVETVPSSLRADAEEELSSPAYRVLIGVLDGEIPISSSSSVPKKKLRVFLRDTQGMEDFIAESIVEEISEWWREYNAN